jgi:hypothetical protein
MEDTTSKSKTSYPMVVLPEEVAEVAAEVADARRHILS